MKKILRLATAAVLATAMAATPAIAFASHFRSSYGSAVMNGDTLEWTLDTAWRSDDADYLYAPSLYSVDVPGAAVEAGTYIGDATISDATYDYSNPLYEHTMQTAYLDGLTANSGGPIADGQYDLYTTSCCRVSGVMNTDGYDDFSQWIRFSKSGSTYNLPPEFNAPTLYLIVGLTGETTVDFTATDPEGTGVTYSEITNVNSPDFGSTGLSCSSFSGGVLTLSPSLCTGSDVFTDIYTPGSFWTYKVQATDADGNFATVDTLLRVITPPEPYIASDAPVRAGNAYELETFAPDTIVDSFTVTCTNDADPTNVRIVTSATSPLTIDGLQPGATYSCDISATNSAGTGDNDQNYSIGPVVMDGLDLALDLAPGMSVSGAQSVLTGGNLKPSSEYTLTRHSTDPVTIYVGTTDPQGNFYQLVTIPQDACSYGVHQLILTGVNVAGESVSDTVWVEMDANCTAVQVSRQEITPTLPEQSLPNTGLTTLGIVLGMMLAGTFFVFASGSFRLKEELQFAGSRERLVGLLGAADARLRRAERSRRR